MESKPIWKTAIRLFLLVIITHVLLIAVPGYFNHDELDIIDFVRKSGYPKGFLSWDQARNAVFYRPMAYWVLAFLLNLGGVSYPVITHIGIVLFHGIVSLAVFFLIRELDNKNEKLAFATGILFATSPLTAYAVGWVAGIYDIFVTGFMVLAMISLVRIKRGYHWVWWVVFVFAVLCAPFCKETWIVLPLYLFLLFYVTNGSGNGKQRSIVALVLGCFIVALYLIVRYPGLSYLAERGRGGYAVALGENILKNLFAYLAFPFELKAREITGIVDRALTVRVLGSIFLFGLVILAAWHAFGRTCKTVLVCLLFWLTYLLPVLPTGKYETHYQYGSGIALAYLLAKVVLSKFRWNRIIGIVAIVLFLGHTANMHFYFYQYGLCQMRFLTSLDVVSKTQLNKAPGTVERKTIAPEKYTWWWVAARTLFGSENTSGIRRNFRFSQNIDEADFLFTSSCVVVPIGETKITSEHP